MKNAPCCIEPLESRIAPAAVFKFTDVDGDLVKVSTSQGTSADLATATHVTGGQLRLLDLSHATWGNEFAGATVTVTVTKPGPAPGNGLVNVGEIDATGIDLGVVAVKGDLGEILAGSSSSTVSAAGLFVKSLGVLGVSTGAAALEDIFAGSVGPVHVKSDVDAVAFTTPTKITSFTIEGSLIGGSDLSTGVIVAAKAGPIKIGGDIRGGSATNTGEIAVNVVGSLAVGGSLLGGPAVNAGSIFVSVCPSVKIGGSIRGGTAVNSGLVNLSDGGTFKLGGSIVGGSATNAGSLDGTNFDQVTIGGSIFAGTASLAGNVSVTDIGMLKVGGDLTGGAATDAGKIAVTNLNSVAIGGSLRGGGGGNSGAIIGTKLGSVKIGGSLLGGAGDLSGSISAKTLGAVSIGGDVIGASILASAVFSPQTQAEALAIKSLTVGGSMENSRVIAGDFGNVSVEIGPVTVKGNWIASNLVAGAANLGTDDATGGTGTAADNVNFGDIHDVIQITSNPIKASIDSIAIGGQVRGTVGGTDHFGFLADKVGSFTVAGTAIPLQPGPNNDFRDIGSTGDATIDEI